MKHKFPLRMEFAWADFGHALRRRSYGRTWRDYVALPWRAALFALLYMYALTWYVFCDWKLYITWDLYGRLGWRKVGNLYGRHMDPDPVVCKQCLWVGMRRWARHGYVGVDEEDVEPQDTCPRCDSEV